MELLTNMPIGWGHGSVLQRISTASDTHLSILVIIPNVLERSLSIFLAKFNASEFTISVVDSESAKMILFLLLAYSEHKSQIYYSISSGCPLTTFLVSPGRST